MADLKDRDGSQRRSWPATVWLCACVAAGLLLAAPAAVQIFGLAPGGRAEASGHRTVNVGDVRVDGRTVNIEDVRAGDTVWAYDTEADEWRPARVVRPQTHDYEGDVVTVSAAGEKIEATGNHPFWVAEGQGLSGRPPAEDVGAHERAMQSDGRWVEARHLQAGDLLLLRNGELATVEELASRRQRLKVYNIEVADLHTYAVGNAGMLVHNKAMSASGPMPEPPTVNPFQQPAQRRQFVGDAKGNVIEVQPGQSMTGSPNGQFLQLREGPPSGPPTGARLDGPHGPTHTPQGQRPHAHLPDVTNPDGTPWLPAY